MLDLDRQLAELDKLFAERFRAEPNADIITSTVGVGVRDLLRAEFLAASGGSRPSPLDKKIEDQATSTPRRFVEVSR